MYFLNQTTEPTTYWSIIINIILKQYFSEVTTCFIWPQNDVFDLKINADNVLINIQPKTLEDSFEQDIFDHSAIEAEQNSNGIYYDKWVKKLLASIQASHCEGFVAFQDDIPRYLEAFEKASVYSIWRSIRNRFLFILSGEKSTNEYFQSPLMQLLPDMLIVYADSINSNQFYLKKNKFIGSMLDHPEELYTVATLSSLNQTNNIILENLYSREMLKNLQGREVVMGLPDYPPFTIVGNNSFPQYFDYSESNPSHKIHVEGIETRIMVTFCEIYNCTIQVDTSEMDWGGTYLNYTGRGIIGLISAKRIQASIGAIYFWYNDYRALDVSVYLGRSGITCLVPRGRPITTWFLALKPFQFTLWLGIIACLFVESLTLFLAHYYQEEFSDGNRLHNENDNLRDAADSYWIRSWQFGYITALKLFISQSTNYVTTSQALRILLFAFYTNDIIVTSLYAGGLSSILTIPTLSTSPDTVQRLYESNILWSANAEAWITSIMDTNNTIYERLVRNFRIKNRTEMMASANAEEYIGFGIESTTYGNFGESEFVTDRALNYLKLMLEDIYYDFSTTMLARLWPLLIEYNNFVMAWHSSGLEKYWEWKISADYLNVRIQNQIKASQYSSMKIGPTQLNMDNFAGILIWWLLGMVISLVVFFGELVLYKWRLKNDRCQIPLKSEKNKRGIFNI